jgi:dethiobiotin synthetase
VLRIFDWQLVTDVPGRRKLITNQCRLTYQKSENLIYTAAEALSQANGHVFRLSLSRDQARKNAQLKASCTVINGPFRGWRDPMLTIILLYDFSNCIKIQLIVAETIKTYCINNCVLLVQLDCQMCLKMKLILRLYQVGRFHPFHRPRKPLGRVEV